MIEEVIRNYGLFAVFLGVVLEGDATMILAGVSSHLKLLSFIGVVLVGVVAAWIGDTIWYMAGRFAGHYLNKKGYLESPSKKMQAFTRKFGIWSIFASRFVYGTRIATMAFWGYHRYSFVKYTIVEFLGCCMWAILLAGLGYSFSKSAEILIGQIRNLEIWLLISVMTAIIIVFLVHAFFKKKQIKESQLER
jgi:membrane protein DedA with SNARE-associated domain